MIAAVLSALVLPVTLFGQAAPATRPNAADHYRRAKEVKYSREVLEVLTDYDTHPLDERVDRVLREHAEVLDHLHRGAAITWCDWGEGDAKNVGSFSDVQEMAFLRARKHASEKRWHEAFDDIVATMVLGRHLASDPDWINRMLGDAMVARGVVRAGEILLDAPAESVDAFLRRVEQLPPELPPAEIVRSMAKSLLTQLDSIEQHPEARQRYQRAGEKLDGVFRGAGMDTNLANAIPAELWEDPKARQRLRDEIGEHAPRVERVLSLPPKELEKGRAEAMAALEAAHEITRLCFKAAFHVREGQDYADAQLRLLLAAVAYHRDGAAALDRFVEPLTGKPPKVEAHDGGFTLTSEVKRINRPATLTVGKRKGEAKRGVP